MRARAPGRGRSEPARGAGRTAPRTFQRPARCPMPCVLSAATEPGFPPLLHPPPPRCHCLVAVETEERTMTFFMQNPGCLQSRLGLASDNLLLFPLIFNLLRIVIPGSTAQGSPLHPLFFLRPSQTISTFPKPFHNLLPPPYSPLFYAALSLGMNGLTTAW